MILSTTPTIEGRRIVEYKGVVFGEVIAGVDFLRDIAASIRNFVGGRSGSYEEELLKARTQAMDEMSDRAAELGAIVNLDDITHLAFLEIALGGCLPDLLCCRKRTYSLEPAD